MNNLFLLIFLLFSDSAVSSQDVLWKTNYDEASRIAQAENKQILLYFSGSDWCKPCIQLKKYVFESSEFQEYSRRNFIMLQADFPRLKKNALSPEQTAHNEMLAEKYNPDGIFPLVLILDHEGHVIKKLEYRHQSGAEFADILKQFEI